MPFPHILCQPCLCSAVRSRVGRLCLVHFCILSSQFFLWWLRLLLPTSVSPLPERKLKSQAELMQYSHLIKNLDDECYRCVSLLVVDYITLTLSVYLSSASLQERYTREGRHHLVSHNHHLYAEPGFTDTDCILQVRPHRHTDTVAGNT